MYQALYRKWRPRTFDDVVGQSHITETLKRQAAEDRLSHAYLFTGTRGTGKTTCAKILSRAVNCEHPADGNPCNECAACRGIEDGSVMDVLELDAASHNGVDQIRDLLAEAVYTPAAVRKRVYIIDEVHMLSGAAFNALLKMLEEPPEHLMFILATTESHKVLATIKSRCQQFAFKRISPLDIAQRLKYVAGEERIPLTSGGAALIARLADGGMRDALSLLDQCAGSGDGGLGEREILDALGLAGNVETAALLSDLAARNAAGALERLDKLYAAGKDVSSLLNELSSLTRDLLIRKTAPRGGSGLLTGGYDEATLRELSQALALPRLAQMLGQLQQVSAGMRNSANRRTDAELCILRLCDETLDDSAAGLGARLSRLEELVGQGGFAAPVSGEREVSAASPDPAEEEPSDDPPPWSTQPPPPKPETLPEAASLKREEPPPPPKREGSAPPLAGFWADMVHALHGKVPAGNYSFLANGKVTQGVIDGPVLTLWVKDDFTRSMLNRPEVLSAVEAQAKQIPGGPYRVVVSVGTPPALAVPSAPAPAAEEDRLDDLLTQFGDIISEE